MGCPIPQTVSSGGTEVHIRRAWPTTRGSFSFEGVDDDDGRVRAGTAASPPTAEVRLLDYGVDHRLPDLASARQTGDVVVHRAGRRAVVRRADGYLKVVRPGGAAVLAERADQGRSRAHAAGLGAPEVLDVAEGWLLMSTVPGVALHSAAQGAAPQQWHAWWQDWATRWPALVSADPCGLPAFTPADEVAVLDAGVTRALARGALTDPTGQGRARTDEVCRELAKVTEPAVGVAHRDLHDKQLLVGPDGIGVLDFDTASVAEPALDLANLAVHARWRTAQGLWTRDQADVAADAAQQAARSLGVISARWEAYAAGTALRLAALYAFRPQWHALAQSWWRQQMRELS